MLCAKNAVRALLLFLSSARPLHLKVCFGTPAQNACFAIGARVLHIADFGWGSPLGGMLSFLKAWTFSQAFLVHANMRTKLLWNSSERKRHSNCYCEQTVRCGLCIFLVMCCIWVEASTANLGSFTVVRTRWLAQEDCDYSYSLYCIYMHHQTSALMYMPAEYKYSSILLISASQAALAVLCRQDRFTKLNSRGEPSRAVASPLFLVVLQNKFKVNNGS